MEIAMPLCELILATLFYKSFFQKGKDCEKEIEVVSTFSVQEG